MGKWEANLPSVLEPIGDICVQVTIPAHPDYVKLFVRAVRMLEVNRNYARDENLSAKIVCEQWRDRTVNPLIEALASGTGMCGVDGECLAYPPFASFISYTPQNPYTEPELIPEDYLLPPFYVNGKDAEHTLPNYDKGDVIVNFGAINLEVGFELENAPQIQLCLEGSGVVELKLLAIAQGGVVVLTVDNPPDIFDILAGIIGDDLLIVDLNQDVISLPPETATEIIQELTIETEGEHIVYITFLPILDDSLIPLRFGGGLRAVDLCGNIRPCGMPAPEPPPPLDGVTELKPEFNFTAECGLEYRLRDQEDNIVQDWQPVPGWVDNAAACFGVGAMTPEQLCEAIECGAIKVAQRVLSGTSGVGFTVNPDGSVSVGGGVADDPETEQNEANEARSGGSMGIRVGYNKFYSDLIGYIDDGLSDATIMIRLNAVYKLNASMEAAVTEFKTDYDAAIPVIEDFTSALDSHLYCEGTTLQGVASYIVGLAVTANEIETALLINGGFEAEQIADWYNKGALVPSTDYLGYPCVPIPVEEFDLDMSSGNAPQYQTFGIWKKGHRFLIEVSGSYADADLPDIVGDGMYFHTLSTGVKTYNALNFNSAGGVSAPIQAEVPFSAEHVYRFTVDKTSTSLDAACFITRDNGAMATPNVTGIIHVKVTDLGEWA